MGAPAIVAGDKIVGTCTSHLVPSASGTQPAGPLPFSAPLANGLSPNVTVDHKPLAVVGSTGFNAPPHAGIVDGAFATATGQIGQVMSGSSTVLVNQKPAATGQSTTRMCVAPGSLVPTVRDVFIGG